MSKLKVNARVDVCPVHRWADCVIGSHPKKCFSAALRELEPHTSEIMTAETSENRWIFVASRWTRGNHWFPLRIEISPQRVSRIKPRLFGSSEESISISQVASVGIRTGLVWSTIQIDSTGGTDPIVSHGHRKEDAIRIRDLIESFQQSAAGSPKP